MHDTPAPAVPSFGSCSASEVSSALGFRDSPAESVAVFLDIAKMAEILEVPSAKRLHNYGKSHFFYGKTHYKWPFSIAMWMFTRGCFFKCWVSGANVKNDSKNHPPNAWSVSGEDIRSCELITWACRKMLNLHQKWNMFLEKTDDNLKRLWNFSFFTWKNFFFSGNLNGNMRRWTLLNPGFRGTRMVICGWPCHRNPCNEHAESWTPWTEHQELGKFSNLTMAFVYIIYNVYINIYNNNIYT